MARTYKVIDADGHILEPLDLWDRYMDPAYRERAPRLIIGDNGKERLLVEGKILGNPKGLGRLGAVGARDGSVPADTMMYKDGRPGGFDPHERIKDLDLDGIDAAFLYPSIGLFSGAVQDPKLAAAMCRAYNRWLADYCKPYPDRLFGIAMLPMQSVDLAIEEMRFARKQLGMKGGFLRPNPYNGRMANHPDYDPFWAEAQELDFSIGFHEGASGGMPTVGVDRFEGRGARHIISHTMEMMLVALAVIWGGTCERFRRSASVSWSPAAAGSRRGSIGWTATSRTRASTTLVSRRAPASYSGGTAGSRSSRSKARSTCSRTTSAPTRFCGRPTIRTPMGSSPERRR